VYSVAEGARRFVVYHNAYQHHLISTKLNDLRPTQAAVGYLEIAGKRKEWAKLPSKKRKDMLLTHVFPCVLGPKRRYYVIDHHHLGVALIDEGVDTAWVAVIDDLSWLSVSVFWRTMEFRRWTHPYDEKGRRVEFQNIPKRLTSLRDDPYRSLAGLIRLAGGFAKVEEPFAEFLWADYLRANIPASLFESSIAKAVNRGIKLARQMDARYLPGWSGHASKHGHEDVALK
jgi:hypothetical protein